MTKTIHHPTETIKVPLSNRLGQTVSIDRCDYERLKAAGVSLTWRMNSNGSGLEYVRADRSGRPIMIARLVLDAPARRQVQYIDGDRTNLTRANIHLTSTGHKYGKGSRPRRKALASVIEAAAQ